MMKTESFSEEGGLPRRRAFAPLAVSDWSGVSSHKVSKTHWSVATEPKALKKTSLIRILWVEACIEVDFLQNFETGGRVPHSKDVADSGGPRRRRCDISFALRSFRTCFQPKPAIRT